MSFLFLDFINSGELDYRNGKLQEHLLEGGWLENLFKTYNLTLPSQLDAVTLEMLVGFRQKLRKIAEKVIAGADLQKADLSMLNQYLAQASLTRRVNYVNAEYILEQVPTEFNWEWIQSEIAASLIDFLGGQDVKRLKICENNNCQWLFYDESKSHTRRYCSDSSCGNLLKVRRFRERQKEAKSSG